MSAGRQSVYVVDDDDAVRESLVFLLSVEGLHVEGYSRADRFLAALPPVQSGCVIVDMNMPGVNGLELLRALKERHARLPAILISGQAGMATRLAAFSRGAFDVVSKPFQDNIILRAVRAALAEAAADPCGIGPATPAFADQSCGSL